MAGPPLDENGEKIPPWRIQSNWNPPQPVFQRQAPVPQPQHAAYTGTSAGYSSFPQANLAAAQCKRTFLLTKAARLPRVVVLTL